MDQNSELMTLLLEINRKLDKQNDRISTLENGKVSPISYKCLCEDKSLIQHDSVRDNVMNEMREGMGETPQRAVRRRDYPRSKVKKSTSFNDRPTRPRTKSPRRPHTIPSDKDESLRIQSFRRECLSKAIQWHTVELVSSTKIDVEFMLPKWLNKEEVRDIMGCNGKKNNLRMFLLVLSKEGFERMSDWLNQSSNLDRNVFDKVWKTFYEFSDPNTNQFSMKCFSCRLIENIDVQCVVDYLHSSGVLSVDLYEKSVKTRLPIGAQADLWKAILKQCKEYNSPEISHRSLFISIFELLNIDNGSQKIVLQMLLEDMKKYESTPNKLYQCYCSELCSQSLHPLSCVQSMSNSRVYFSPPTRRKNEPSSDEPTTPTSSDRSSPELPVSPVSSVSSVHQTDKHSHATRPKQVFNSLNTDSGAHSTNKTLAKSCTTKRARDQNVSKQTQDDGAKLNYQRTNQRSTRSNQKFSQRQEMSRVSSSTDSFDGEVRSAPGMAAVNYNVHNEQRNSQRLEHKPQIVYAKTVNIASQVYLQEGKRQTSSSDE